MDTLIKILDETTSLQKDVTLFAYEMPLDTIGLWVSDAQTDSRFNSPDMQEFDIYYRGKTKQSAIQNIAYLKNRVDTMSTDVCRLEDGTSFKLQILFTWDYLEKDSEGYFVFANRLRLMK